MEAVDRLREFAEKLTEPDQGSDEGPAKGSPAAAGGGSGSPRVEPGEVSQGGSSFDDPQTAEGGADAVPGTPDATPSTGMGEGAEVT